MRAELRLFCTFNTPVPQKKKTHLNTQVRLAFCVWWLIKKYFFDITQGARQAGVNSFLICSMKGFIKTNFIPWAESARFTGAKTTAFAIMC